MAHSVRLQGARSVHDQFHFLVVDGSFPINVTQCQNDSSYEPLSEIVIKHFLKLFKTLMTFRMVFN